MQRPSPARFQLRLSKSLMIKTYLIFGLCMDSDVFVLLFGHAASTVSGQSSLLHSESSNPILFALTSFFMLWTLALALPIYRTVITALLMVPWFTAIYVESLGSMVWSTNPNNTFRYGITLWVYMLCGLIVSLYLSTDTIVHLIGNAVFTLALISFPAQRIFTQDTTVPGWTGIYGEKNHLGIGMTIGLIAIIVPRTRWTALRVFKVGIMCVLLALSQSGTAVVCTLVAVLVVLVLRTEGRLRRLILVTVSGVVILATVAIPNLLDKVLAVGGKNTTLTGRDVIWHFSTQQWARKPLLGWGYTAFWSTEEALIYQNLHWNPGHSHNGFLEIGLALGIVGVVIIVMILVTSTRLAFRIRRSVNELAGTWLLCSLSVLFLHDLTEVDFLLPAPLWFIFTVVLFTALRDAQERVGSQQLSKAQISSGQAIDLTESLHAV